MLKDTNCEIICNKVSRPHKDSDTPAWLQDKKEYIGSQSNFTNSNEEPVLFNYSTFVDRQFLIQGPIWSPLNEEQAVQHKYLKHSC